MKSGVYYIRHIRTEKLYVGATKHLTRRFADHRRALERKEHWCAELQYAWDQDGEPGFEFVVLERVVSADLVEREQHYLDALQPFGDRGFNTARKANSARRDKPLPPEEAARWGVAFKGKRHSQYSRDRIREAKLKANWQRGRPWSAEQRENTLAKKKSGEQHHYFGKQRDEAVKLAISLKNAAPIVQMTMDDEIIRVWPSAYCATSANGWRRGALSSALAGAAKSARGFRWRYEYQNQVKRYRKDAA